MKSSDCIVLNLKDEYSRCMIPDITLGDRGWNIDKPQRQTAKFEGKPRIRVRGVDKTEDINSRRARELIITFSRKSRQNSKRKRSEKSIDRRYYKKKTKLSGTYRRTSEEIWKDLSEKAKQYRYREDESKEKVQKVLLHIFHWIHLGKL